MLASLKWQLVETSRLFEVLVPDCRDLSMVVSTPIESSTGSSRRSKAARQLSLEAPRSAVDAGILPPNLFWEGVHSFDFDLHEKAGDEKRQKKRKQHLGSWSASMNMQTSLQTQLARGQRRSLKVTNFSRKVTEEVLKGPLTSHGHYRESFPVMTVRSY